MTPEDMKTRKALDVIEKITRAPQMPEADLNGPADSAASAPAPLELTMYHLDLELAQLLEYRMDRLEDIEDPPTATEIDVLDGEIRRYLQALPQKVTGTVAIFRAWRARREAAKAEADRYKAIVARIEANEKRLKEYCAYVLERQPKPAKGSRKLVGADGSMLMLKTNGGILPLEVDGWDGERFTGDSPLPAELRTATVEMPMNMFLAFERDGIPRLHLVSTAPANAEIRSTLHQDCPACGGSGIDVNNKPGGTYRCMGCDGSGKQLVPGARLGERGSHVEVK